MLTEDQREAAIAATKIGSVWAVVGITSWADFAAALAAIYSLLMIFDFCCKKFARDWFVRFGLVKPLERRKSDRRPKDAKP